MEKCGIYGVYCKNKNKYTVHNVIKGLELLQHRGREGCGICYTYNNDFIIEKKNGLVKDVFKNYENSNKINKCIGHVRYSTSGKSKTNRKASFDECQPLINSCELGTFSIAHNGNIPNLTIHDTTYISQFISKLSCPTWEERLIKLMNTIPGVYCLIIITKNNLYALRDRFGVRPLCVGFKKNDWCVSSESIALQHYNHLRDIKPGEIVKIGKNGLQSIYIHPKSVLSICAFEFIYFLRPNSYVDGYYVKDVRFSLGMLLAQKDKDFFKTNDYIVCGIPDSGILSARSYADTINFPYVQCVEKYINAGRTFILPSNKQRQEACYKKFYFRKKMIENKKIIIVDDTIVRGNVIKNIIKFLKTFNAKEIHIRIPAPPVCNICQLGIDIPTLTELLVFNKTIEDVRKELEVDSIKYLTCNDLNKILPKESYKECFGGGIDENIINWDI